MKSIMASLTELKSALKETLEVRGVLTQLRARMRAEVFRALDDPSEPRPLPGQETLLINELIREYLQFHKYHHTESVFITESGQQDVPLDRAFITSELNIVEEPSIRTLPLLYGVMSHFLKERQSVHKATTINTWFDEFGVEEFDCPTRSPDLNPIKHLWDELERRLSQIFSSNISV